MLRAKQSLCCKYIQAGIQRLTDAFLIEYSEKNKGYNKCLCKF